MAKNIYLPVVFPVSRHPCCRWHRTLPSRRV